MLIDWHTNLNLPEHFAGGSAEEMQTRTLSTQSGDPAAHEKHVASVAEKFIVLTQRFNRIGLKVPNEFVADYVHRFPGRAIGLACVDPADEDAPQELERALRELGLKGLKISPVYAGFDPWSPAAWRLYEICDRYKAPLLWHQSAAYARESTMEFGNPILLDKIGRAFPKLPMILAHVGQPWIGECVVLLRKHPQIFADLSARFHRKWQLHQALMLALDYKVVKQIVFGSDFPLRSTSEALAEFRTLNDWGPGAAMPVFPPDLVEDIIDNRPLELCWPDGY